MNISEHEYRGMCRDAVKTLEDVWGKERFEQWYQENILPLNGKVYLDYHSYYTILASEINGLLDLYDEVFQLKSEEERWQEHERTHNRNSINCEYCLFEH